LVGSPEIPDPEGISIAIGLLIKRSQRVHDVVEAHMTALGGRSQGGLCFDRAASDAQAARITLFSLKVRSGSSTTSEGWLNA
jgi:hypothetical protein